MPFILKRFLRLHWHYKTFIQKNNYFLKQNVININFLDTLIFELPRQVPELNLNHSLSSRLFSAQYH